MLDEQSCAYDPADGSASGGMVIMSSPPVPAEQAALGVSCAPSNPVPPPRSNSRWPAHVHASACSLPVSTDLIHDSGAFDSRAGAPTQSGRAKLPTMVLFTPSPTTVRADDANTFSKKLQQWKALETPVDTHRSVCGQRSPQETFTPRQMSQQAGLPKLTPRQESKCLLTVHNEKLEVPSSKNVWEEKYDTWSGQMSSESNDSPPSYDYATATLLHREQIRAEQQLLCGGQTDAAMTLGNVWSGSSRDIMSAGPPSSGVSLNMVGASQSMGKDDGHMRTLGARGLRATWSEGAGTRSTNDLSREFASGEIANSSAWLTRETPSASKGILRASFQGPVGPMTDGRIDASILTSTVPGIPSPTAKNSLLGEKDVFSMRNEMLQRAEKGKGNKARGANMADLPHIGPTQHAVLGLPLNTSSRLAAAAATAGDSSGWNNRSTTVGVVSSQPGDMLISQTSSGDEGKECSRRAKTQIVLCSSDDLGRHFAVPDLTRGLNQLEQPKSSSSADVRDLQTLEWFCMRKHNKYSLQRKSKLMLVVDELGRICLTRRSPILNPMDRANVLDAPHHLDTYGTPSKGRSRESHRWISSAMKTFGKRQHSPLGKRQSSPTKANSREDNHAQHHSLTASAKSRAPDDPSPMAGQISPWGGLSDDDDPFHPHPVQVLAGEKSALRHVDAVLRLGGQSARHMVQIECVSFKEKHKESLRKKTEENIHVSPGPSGGHLDPKSKDVAQGDTGKGTLVIKFKDGSSVQLSGMQVQDVASDLKKRISLWEQRRKKQSTSLDRLVLMAKTKVSWDKPQHRQMLESFWQAVYVDIPMPEPSLHVTVSPGWKDMGFQSNDPCTDFRAMGLLGLHCLWYHSTNYPSRVRTIVHAGKPARDFPYAAVGINLVASLVQMLRLGQSGGHVDVEGTALFEFFCKMPSDEYVESDSSTDAHGAKVAHKSSHAAKEHHFAFEETFCATYEMLDDMWVEDPPANILFFNTLLERCRELLRQLFDKRCFHSLAELRAAIRDYVPTSEHVQQQTLSNAGNVSSDSTSSASAPKQLTSQHKANSATGSSLLGTTTQVGAEIPAASDGRTDPHDLAESSATVDESAAATSSVTADSTQDDTHTPDRAPAGLQCHRHFEGSSLRTSPSKGQTEQMWAEEALLHEDQASAVHRMWSAPDISSWASPHAHAPDARSVAPASVNSTTAKCPHRINISPPSGPMNYMLDTDMAPVNYMLDTDMGKSDHDGIVVRDTMKANEGVRGPDSQHVAPRAATNLQIYPAPNAEAPRNSASYTNQSVFDHPTARVETPDRSSHVMPTTTNVNDSGVSGGKGGEWMREGAMGVDGAVEAAAMRALEIDGVGKDSATSPLHQRLLDHDSDEEGATQARQ